MKKVLVATDKPFAAVAVEGIRKVIEIAGYELILLEKYTSADEWKNAAADVDAMIIRSDIANREIIEAAPNLKVIVRAGAGYDNIDLAACTEKGVVAMNTPGQNSNAVAELAFGMMLYSIRNGFNGSSGTELRGRTLGIHAYGNVGKYVAKIAIGFGMDVYALDPFVKREVIEKDMVKPVDNIEELYSKCQFISLHVPANEKTKKMINYDLMKIMPHGATIVNTARKEVIDEESLMRIMEERQDFRYLSDIAPDNKAQLEEKFASRLVLTAKKMGAQTSEANINAGIAAANQIVDFFEKGETTFKVNK
jgi:D-3-phosphoglycerate dehydrogenase / 2-oxoglutarate reductase